jgi:hypothetical protein
VIFSQIEKEILRIRQLARRKGFILKIGGKRSRLGPAKVVLTLVIYISQLH